MRCFRGFRLLGPRGGGPCASEECCGNVFSIHLVVRPHTNTQRILMGPFSAQAERLLLDLLDVRVRAVGGVSRLAVEEEWSP